MMKYHTLKAGYYFIKISEGYKICYNELGWMKFMKKEPRFIS